MAMTKKEFAARLLFWLLPWPVSKILPRSVRIYYWGPAGTPPATWLYYYGSTSTGPTPTGLPWPSNPPSPKPKAPSGWMTALDDTYWKTEYHATWNVDHWDFLGDFAVSIRVTGEWFRGYRPTYMTVVHDFGAGLQLTLFNAGEPGWVFAGVVVSGVANLLDFSGDSDADITCLEHDAGAGGCDFDISMIRFFS